MASDDFNRADAGDLGASWNDVVDGYKVASNKATPVNFGANQYSNYISAASGTDQFSEGVLADSPFTVGVVVNLADRGGGAEGVSCYAFVGGGGVGGTSLRRVEGGVSVQTYWNDAGTLAAGDTIKLELASGVLTASKNGVQVNATQAVSSFTGGQPGIFGNFTGFDSFDSWNGGDLGGGGGGPVIPVFMHQYRQRAA